MHTDILRDYGLSEKEAQVYLTSLSLGSAPASSIARKMNENRVTVYSILKKFTTDGIAYSITKKNTTFYHVISPDDLCKNLEAKYTKFKEKLPELNALASLGWNKPKVQFFEGIEWLKQLYIDTLSSDVPGESFLWDQKMNKTLENRLYSEYLPQRIKKWVKFRVIVANKEQSKYYYNITKKDLIEKKHIPWLSFWVQGEIQLYWPNKVAISMDHDDELAWLLIESKQLYTSMKNIFDFIRSQNDEANPTTQQQSKSHKQQRKK